MRKVFICLLAILIIIPLSAVSVSAASYDLGSPTFFSSWNLTAYDEDYVFHTMYYYDSSSDEVFAATGLEERVGLALYESGRYSGDPNVPNAPILWSFNYRPNFPERYSFLRSFGYDPSLPVLSFSYYNSFVSNQGDLDKLFFPAIKYDNIIIPSSGQYLKVSFSFQSIQNGSIPSAMNYLMDVKNFAFLADDNYSGGITTPFYYQWPATVVVKKLSNRTYEYSYYFNYSDSNFDVIDPLTSLDLVIRFPYFVGSNIVYFSDFNVSFLSNAVIPTTYEILTIGGYDQELAAIENAIITSNQNLIDLYTEQSSEDKNFVIQIKNTNSQLENSVDDYKNAASSVDSIKNDFVLPPLNNTVKDNLEDLDPAEVKDLFSVPWIASAIGLVFSFAIVRLILYGTKEG